MSARRPILNQTCAVASTSAEARYRINFNDFPQRDSRIIALDHDATRIVRDLALLPWEGGRFFFYGADAAGTEPQEAWLTNLDGQQLSLVEQISGSDSVVMIATQHADPEAAAFIGDVCAEHRVMSAAFLVGAAYHRVDVTLRVLRPNAMVLVVVQDEADLPDFLTALRV